MEGIPNWKLNSENQHTFNGISEKTDFLKMSTLKNPTFTFDIKYGLTIVIKYVGFC
jgi:hypothetical protein